MSGMSSSLEKEADSTGRGATVLGPGMTGGIMVCCTITLGVGGTGTSGITTGRGTTEGGNIRGTGPPCDNALTLSDNAIIPFVSNSF